MINHNPSMQIEQYIQMEALVDSAELNHANEMIMRSGLRFYNNHCFKIPQSIADRYFGYYKLLYWSGSHILESIEAGFIVRDDICFKVQYHKELNRGKILAASKQNCNEQYILSFRSANKDWQIDPVVIISEGRS